MQTVLPCWPRNGFGLANTENSSLSVAPRVARKGKTGNLTGVSKASEDQLAFFALFGRGPKASIGQNFDTIEAKLCF
ncbi:hypothetical protein V6N12_072047 [Hibiscus sabdariffa]|uniref:Uncharacterized protein n=1 Tax=Hibiscus sabdariffa TaxID=183260 RepID=A0ABR2FLV1_9ROSI